METQVFEIYCLFNVFAGWVAARGATVPAAGVEVVVAPAAAGATVQGGLPLTEQVGGYGCCAGRCGGCWL